MMTPNILVLGTADWNQPIATNQHYVVRELCRDGFADVTFVESMALRAPKLNRRDVQRVVNRINRRSAPNAAAALAARPRPDGLRVISPLTLPWHRGAARTVNRLLLKRLTGKWQHAASPRILWTYTPATYGLEDYADITVYHCVDLLGEVPGIDPRVIAHNEKRLARLGVHAIATSKVVQAHLEDVGFENVTLWENVADVEVFATARERNLPRVPGRAIFAGNLTPSKIDYDLLLSLRQHDVDVVLAGPRSEGGDRDSSEFDRLTAAGVRYLGMLSLEELAEETAQASVGLIPYLVNDYTKGVSPLKTFEYAAAGLPIVSSAIPGVTEVEDEVWVEEENESFARTVVQLVHDFSQSRSDRLAARAAQKSWTGRGVAIRGLVGDLLFTGQQV